MDESTRKSKPRWWLASPSATAEAEGAAASSDEQQLVGDEASERRERSRRTPALLFCCATGHEHAVETAAGRVVRVNREGAGAVGDGNTHERAL